MKTATIRLIIIVSLLAAAGIILTQIFWVRQAHMLDEAAFEQRARAALQAVAREVSVQNRSMPPQEVPVEKVSPSFFVAETPVPVEKEVLQQYLSRHLLQYQLPGSFEFLLYDRDKGALSYQEMVAAAGQKPVPGWEPAQLPVLPRENYYFGVYFPHRTQAQFSELSPWIWSSFGLLALLGLLGYLLLIVFRQKQLNEVQKNFVSNMTHEFKTPLSAIQLSADVLKSPNIINQPQRLLNYATIISNESSLLASQVERLLEVSEQEERGLSMEKKTFIWQELIESTVALFLETWQAKGCQPGVHLMLPEAPVSGLGDPRHLKNALINILDNAAIYCRNRPEIDLALQVGVKNIELSIKDNGIGIAKEHQRLLFQKFYRVPNGKLHDYKGFGLGLNYVRLIVKGHGGGVSCVSETGKGSIFTLSFPIKTPGNYERNQSKHSVSGR